MTKQVIVMRRDLNMRKGKMIAQGAHASLAIFFNRIQEWTSDTALIENIDKSMKEWMTGSFTKVCVYVNSEEELISIINKAKELDLPNVLITDSGKTEFDGNPTKTCAAIGPAESEDLDKVTGHLPLL